MIDHDFVSLHGWGSFYVWLGCWMVSGTCQYISLYVPNLTFDTMFILHILSGASLLVGTTVGLLKIQDIFRARKALKKTTLK